MKYTSWGLCPSSWYNSVLDDFSRLVESSFSESLFKSSGYPVNISKEEKDGVVSDVIEVALAGIDKSRVNVTVVDNNGESQLVIAVNKSGPVNKEVVSRNISNKSWVGRYSLPSHDTNSVVATLKDGLLAVSVNRKSPPKPVERQVEIT